MKKKLADYHPPKGLANRHLQTILSTTGPRRFWVEKRARRLLEKSNPKIVTTKDKRTDVGVLHFVGAQHVHRGLQPFIHGEG